MSVSKALEHAQGAALNYDGSFQSDTALVDAVAAYEDVFEQGGQDAAPEPMSLIDGALSRLGAAWKNARSLEELTASLAAAGAKIQKLPHSIISPMRQSPSFGSGRGGGYEVKTRPRVAKVLSALQERGVRTDHLDIKIAPPEEGAMRKHPYVIINVHNENGNPEEGLQLLICDQVGQVGFSSSTIYPPEFFKDIDKTKISALPGMRRVPEGKNSDQYIERLLAPIHERGRALKPQFSNAVKKNAQEVQKIKLSVPLIFARARQEIKKTGDTLKTGDRVYFPDGTTGTLINNAFSGGTRGLKGTFNSLRECLRAHGLTGEYTADDVADLIKDWIAQNNGEEPGVESGEVRLKNGIITNFRSIDDNIRSNQEKFGGLRSLAALKEHYGLTSRSYTADDVAGLVKEWIAEHEGKEPTVKSGEVQLKNGIIANFHAIDKNMSKYPEKFGGLKGLGAFKKHYGLKKGMPEYEAVMAGVRAKHNEAGAPLSLDIAP